ncbi:MAG: hypothetical protein BWK76_11775 [Desulfobulbaceae bacterium A2]|nr:MAG: hypothetical protein BWK76_11775 [Desulfobulbaceae bacterium A2]
MNTKTAHQILFYIAHGVFILIMTCSFILFPLTMNATVKNTHHDFSNWGEEELCKACHTPHHANTTVSQSPLWNHQVTTSAYTLYNSPTMQSTPTQPTSISRLCLSCHDGTIAVDAFGANAGTYYMRSQTSHGVPIAIGTKLNSHHPVSIQYDSTLAAQDSQLYNPDTTPSGLGGTISHDMLNGGVLECSSCHDVHVARGTGNCMDCHSDFTFPNYYLNTKSLVKSNEGSALCFTCHKK